MFVDKYTYTTTFQLPLFQGAPTPQMLKQLAREPCRDWMERNIRNDAVSITAKVLCRDWRERKIWNKAVSITARVMCKD